MQDFGLNLLTVVLCSTCMCLITINHHSPSCSPSLASRQALSCCCWKFLVGSKQATRKNLECERCPRGGPGAPSDLSSHKPLEQDGEEQSFLHTGSQVSGSALGGQGPPGTVSVLCLCLVLLTLPRSPCCHQEQQPEEDADRTPGPALAVTPTPTPPLPHALLRTCCSRPSPRCPGRPRVHSHGPEAPATSIRW
jgi:hypothetical protein